jgi:hypothetical protein
LVALALAGVLGSEMGAGRGLDNRHAA